MAPALWMQELSSFFNSLISVSKSSTAFFDSYCLMYICELAMIPNTAQHSTTTQHNTTQHKQETSRYLSLIVECFHLALQLFVLSIWLLYRFVQFLQLGLVFFPLLLHVLERRSQVLPLFIFKPDCQREIKELNEKAKKKKEREKLTDFAKGIPGWWTPIASRSSLSRRPVAFPRIHEC